MHIPDGFINGATSAGFGVAAAGGLGAAIKQTGRYLSEGLKDILEIYEPVSRRFRAEGCLELPETS